MAFYNDADDVDEYDFVEPPPVDYFCPVTYEILKDPRQTSECCGKHLSREVAERLESEQKPCPLCNTFPLKTSADIYFKRRVLELQVRCFNRRLGCEWTGDLGDVEKHVNIGCVEGGCSFTIIECKCGRELQRQKYEKHVSNECAQRLITCKSCGVTCTYEQITRQSCPRCQSYHIPCPNKCTDIVWLRDIQRHYDEECPLQEVECQYSYANCSTMVKRNEMQKHMDESKEKHLELVDRYARDLTTRFDLLSAHHDACCVKPDCLMDTPMPYTHHHVHHSSSLFEPVIPPSQAVQKRKTKAVKIINPDTKEEVNLSGLASRSVQASLHTNLPYKTPINMIMTDFQAHKNDDSTWYSPPFSTGRHGYKLCLAVDANGWGDGEGTHVGVSIFMMKGEHDDHLPWPFKGEIRVQLINHYVTALHIEKCLVQENHFSNENYSKFFGKVVKGDKSESAWGFPKFISHEDLSKREQNKFYLKNDTLTFRIVRASHTSHRH